MGNRIKLGEYDSHGNPLGEWYLPEDFGHHSKEFENLLSGLNRLNENGDFIEWVRKYGWDMDDNGSLHIVAEDMSGKILYGVCLDIGKDRKYHVTRKN